MTCKKLRTNELREIILLEIKLSFFVVVSFLDENAVLPDLPMLASAKKELLNLCLGSHLFRTS